MRRLRDLTKSDAESYSLMTMDTAAKPEAITTPFDPVVVPSWSQGCIKDLYLIISLSAPLFHPHLPIDTHYDLVKVLPSRPVGLRFIFSLRQSSFRDQSHLGTWCSRWTASRHDLHQWPIPRPSANIGLWRQCRGKRP